MKKRALEYLQKLLAEGDGSPSTKRWCYAAAVAATLVFCASDIALHRGLTSNSLELSKALLYATGGAYVGGRFAETRDTP